MKTLSYMACVVLAFALMGCGEKQDQSDAVPPGFCKTEAECQPEADRQNSYQEKLRGERVAQGVHDQYLPCGKYVVSKAPNGYWRVTKDTAGCPATASQQDPHPDLGKARKSTP
jgi:hypothetical protein